VTPQVFGEYLLVARLVERSMAEVYLAVRLGDRSGRTFVVKRAPLDERASGSIAESLRREAEVLREGKLDGVVALADAGEVAGLPYVVLEHVKGASLDNLLTRGALPREAAMLVARDLARALAGLHARGWVHGDVTPSNVIIDEAGEVVLLDLGIARRVGEAREMPAGKPGYASPEAALGKPASPSDDVYGWGTVVAECIIGARLFRETDLAEAGARNDGLPLPVEEIASLRAALALNGSRRPAAAEIVDQLPVDAKRRHVLADAVLSAEMRGEDRSTDVPVHRTASDPGARRMVQATSVRPGPFARTRAVVIALAGLAVAVALVSGFVLGRRTKPKDKDKESASLTVPLVMPRAEVRLDDRILLKTGGANALPIEPGAHKLTVQMPRRERQEYEFVAGPGDHVVLVMVPVARKDKGARDSD